MGWIIVHIIIVIIFLLSFLLLVLLFTLFIIIIITIITIITITIFIFTVIIVIIIINTITIIIILFNVIFLHIYSRKLVELLQGISFQSRLSHSQTNITSIKTALQLVPWNQEAPFIVVLYCSNYFLVAEQRAFI